MRSNNNLLTFKNVVLFLAAVTIGQTISQNPMWLGRSVGEEKLPSNETFPIYTSHPVLDAVLEHHAEDIGSVDYEKYRGHCLRVLSFAGYYLRRYEEYNTVDEIPAHIFDVMALALAYHDIGLWTAGKLHYLEPSAEAMMQDWQAAAVPGLPAFSPADLETARVIIMEHHRYNKWMPPADDSTVDRAAVNAVRRGDWADATVGFVKTGLPPSFLEQAYNVIPEAGFHRMLLDFGGRLSPNSFVGRLEVLKIFKW
jgi:hypothetical protein